MQGYTNNQNAALLFLRIVTAVIFYVAAYVKFAFWSHAPEGISPFMLFTTRLLSIAEPLGATAVLIDRPEVASALRPGTGAILVNDSREGYLGIAARHRQQLNHLVWFGVTGSVGKSTTKETVVRDAKGNVVSDQKKTE